MEYNMWIILTADSATLFPLKWKYRKKKNKGEKLQITRESIQHFKHYWQSQPIPAFDPFCTHK